MIYGFKPIVNEFSKVLILGSMPSRDSLKQNKYYGFYRNQFWKIIYYIFNEKYENEYDKRVEFLLENKIALWDVLKSCEREGSLDVNINCEVTNDFKEFLDKYKNIKYIFFNGTKSMNIFKKYYDLNFENVKDYILLPSTSPANTQKYETKLLKWSKIYKRIKEDA